jgi:PAS domain S-box-containing protein
MQERAGIGAELPALEGPAGTFSIVGLGASSGGLAAIQAFFSAMPAHAEHGMDFVLVQHPAEMQDGKAVRPFGALQDISKRNRVEESLHKADDLLRLAVVVRDAHDAITVQDLAGRTLAWNAGAKRLYDWTEAEGLALNVRDRVPESVREAARATLSRADKAGQMVAIATTERARAEGKT